MGERDSRGLPPVGVLIIERVWLYSQKQLLPWFESLRQDVPGLSFSDAHTHLGLHDPAGLEATSDELLEALEQVDSRALVFPLKEPGGYREATRRCSSSRPLIPKT